jgi:pimeloyl-ACP methyl ester carboxylesterase
MRLRTHRPAGMVLTDHRFTVPLDHGEPGGETIAVFAREVVATGRESDDLPWLIFFQGGPGSESPRPRTPDQHWMGRALKDWRVLLLDQRGTGRSTPMNAGTLADMTPQQQADRLAHFRADNIVRDAEHIRQELLGDAQWDLVGQSYGGFCITTYLSLAPHGVREAYVTGGLPPLERSPEDVYRALYPRVRDKNGRYFDRYPDDRPRLAAIAELMAAEDVRLPSGDRLTPERLQCLGLAFGMSQGYEDVHYLVEEAFPDDGDRPDMTARFLRGVEAATCFDENPLFAILHEPIYTQGRASRWAAHRVRDEFPEFDPAAADFLFTGEMMFPWMFEQHAALRPLREAAELLAERSDWPPLYDADVLAECQARTAAVVYHDDMYVDATGSLETARVIRGLRAWVTNEYEHDGIGRDGDRVFDRLVKLARGEI